MALATLYRRHAASLLGYLERVLGERADAEDVCHDAFLRLFEGRGRYRGEGRFRAWLFTVATHLARDRMKRRRRRRELRRSVEESMTPPAPADVSEDAQRRELLKLVELALGDLPPAYAMAFHLRVREEYSYGEIAAISGEPEGTLRSRVHHALMRIRRVIDPGGSVDPARRRQEDESR